MGATLPNPYAAPSAYPSMESSGRTPLPEQLEAVLRAAPLLHRLFDKEDLAVWVTDTERFLYVSKHGSFDVDFDVGDALKPNGTPRQVIETQQRVVRIVPPDVYGVSCKTIGLPVVGGAFGVAFSIEYEEALQRDLASLQTIASSITGAGRTIADNAQALQNFMLRVSQDLQEAGNQLTAVGALGTSMGAIAEDARYISLNALIEAHRVGTAGHSFVVVATEMKELSVKTREFVVEVSKTLKSMQARFAALSNAVSTARSQANEQSSATQSISRELQTVSESIRRIEHQAREL